MEIKDYAKINPLQKIVESQNRIVGDQRKKIYESVVGHFVKNDSFDTINEGLFNKCVDLMLEDMEIAENLLGAMGSTGMGSVGGVGAVAGTSPAAIKEQVPGKFKKLNRFNKIKNSEKKPSVVGSTLMGAPKSLSMFNPMDDGQMKSRMDEIFGFGANDKTQKDFLGATASRPEEKKDVAEFSKILAQLNGPTKFSAQKMLTQFLNKIKQDDQKTGRNRAALFQKAIADRG